MGFYLRAFRAYCKIYEHITWLRGSHRVKKYLESKIELSAGKIVEFEILNTCISAPSNTSQAWGLYTGERNFEELDQLEYILQNIKSDDVFADVGASFGLFSSVVAQNTGAEVHAFEPLSLNVCFQKLNCEIYEYDFNINQVAVSNEKGFAELNIAQDSHGRNHIADNLVGKRARNTQKVKQIRLDDNLESIDFIKIDTEGAELDVLRGMTKLIEECKPVILLELHMLEIQQNFGHSKQKVLAFLEEKGYNVPDNVERGNNNIILEPRN